jgi:hypothetical protein
MSRRFVVPVAVAVVVALGCAAATASSLPGTPAVLAASPAAPRVVAGAVGSDISWPQCGRAYPATPPFAIVGVTDGRPYTENPCLVSEYRWARASGVVEYYMNTANPGVALGDAYNYGFNAARDAYGYATSHVSAGPGHLWWLDVETDNSWSNDHGANTTVIAGSIAFFRSHGVAVGIYSTRFQWGVITGGAAIPSVPNWVPGAESATEAATLCAPSQSFSGGPVAMTQFTTLFDYDYACPGANLDLAPPAVSPVGIDIANLLAGLLAWINSL